MFRLGDPALLQEPGEIEHDFHSERSCTHVSTQARTGSE
jgi:hypothetical protein